MYTAAAVLDIHTRAHRSLAGLMEHCLGLPAGLAGRALEGFAYPTLREQLHHAICAERYWIGVLQGRMVVDDDLEKYPDMPALIRLREQVAAAAADFIRGATERELNEPRPVKLWTGREAAVKPALVVLRISTHYYDHKGQISAMCRALGHPTPPRLDFPLD